MESQTKYIKTTALDKILQMKSRLRIVQGGSCFVMGTPVLMVDNTYKNIEDIKKGDKVLTMTSNLDIIGSEVYDHWKNQANKPIITFSYLGESIEATYDHKFYTPDGYQELYKIIWGKLETSQRIQLELLCKQYGQDIDTNTSWRQEAGNYETSNIFTQETIKTIPNTKNSYGWKDNICSQGSSSNLAPKSQATQTSGSHQWQQLRQSCSKPRMGNCCGKYSKSIQNGINKTPMWRTEWKGDIKRQTSDGTKDGVGYNPQIQKEGVSGDVWGLGSMYQGYSRIQMLSPFTPEQIQIQEPKETFAISVENENYFVGKNNINVANSAGKTIALLLILMDIAQSSKNKLISVVSETIPHLKRGAIRDFLNIMQAHNYYKDANWNKTDYVYKFETGSQIEFFSADSQDKVRGPRRDILFINECNNISYDTYTQLAIRTNDHIYLDYNPVSEFWVHTEIIPTLPHDFAIITYKDNEALPEAIKDELERRRGNKYFWTVYGLGEIGEVEGKIYKDWLLIDEVPHEARLVRYGLDFGYTNDPTACIGIYEHNGGYILDEIIYQKGLSNKQIADTLLNQQSALVIADSAEPKSIDEIRSYGINIIPSEKGKDSVVNGIQYVQELRISVTKRSTNTIREYRNYFWVTDKDGHVINEPDVGFDHSNDAIRYALTSLRNKQTDQAKVVAERNRYNLTRWQL